MSRYQDHKPLVIFLCITIFFGFAFTYREGIRFYRFNVFTNYRKAIEQKIKLDHGPLGVTDVGVISPWMTFSYINIIFKLPENYLQTALSLHDIHYPNITLSHYAKTHNIQSDTLVGQVQTAIVDHLNNN